MNNVPSLPDPTRNPHSRRRGAVPWVFFGFLAVAGFFFFTEHRAHLMGALPFILLAMCPLMHLFHGGHGGHAHHSGAGGHGDRAPARDAGSEIDDGPSDRATPALPASRPPAPHQH